MFKWRRRKFHYGWIVVIVIIHTHKRQQNTHEAFWKRSEKDYHHFTWSCFFGDPLRIVITMGFIANMHHHLKQIYFIFFCPSILPANPSLSMRTLSMWFTVFFFTTVWSTTDLLTTVGWDRQSRLFIPKEIITRVLCWFKVILLQKSGRVNFVFGFNHVQPLNAKVHHLTCCCLCQRQSSDSVWIHWCLPLFGWLWVVRTPICRIQNSSFGTICIIQKQTT